MRRHTTLLLALLPPLLLSACGDKDSSTDSAGEELDAGGVDGEDGEDGDGGTVDCGSTPPTITNIVASNNGLAETSEGMAPSVLLEITANDPDGDLHELIADVYMDQEVDGEVATDSSTFDPSVASLNEPACEVNDVTLSLALAFPEGTAATLGAPAEFGVYVYDAGGNLSNYYVVEACLPFEDGSDGDCAGGGDVGGSSGEDDGGEAGTGDGGEDGGGEGGPS